MVSPVRAIIRLTLYLCLTLVTLPVQCFAVIFRLKLAVTFPLFYHRLCARIVGIDIETRGTMSARRATLFVSNHTSYIDISILGSLVPGSFVAKAEVADWPGFGILAKLQRTVFVDRRARLIASQRDLMMRRLDAGENLILFPEGTSSDGNRVLPFKSALFSVAELEIRGEPITVQPVSVAYTRLDGMPLGRHLRPFYAWYGDMELAPHFWRMMGLGRMTAVVEFHPEVTITQFGDRKTLAAHCQDVISRGVAEALSGRPQGTQEARAAA